MIERLVDNEGRRERIEKGSRERIYKTSTEQHGNITREDL